MTWFAMRIFIILFFMYIIYCLFVCMGGYYDIRLVSLSSYTKRQIVVIHEVIYTCSSGCTHLCVPYFLIAAIIRVTVLWRPYTWYIWFIAIRCVNLVRVKTDTRSQSFFLWWQLYLSSLRSLVANCRAGFLSPIPVTYYFHSLFSFQGLVGREI